jgi:exopolysaccharide production protein ExoZ
MLYSIQAYRGFAVLFVVLFHGANKVESKYGIVPSQGFFSFGFSGVHLFFVLSGFIILTAHVKDINNPEKLFWYLKRRLIRIYPIYWILFLVLGGWKLLSVNADVENFFLNAFAFMSNTKLVIPVSWTMLYEVIFYFVFAVLIINKKTGSIAIVVWFALILLSWGNYNYHLVYPFNLLFIFGMLGSVLYLKLKKINNGIASLVSRIGFGIGAILFVTTAVYYSSLDVGASEWPAHPVTIFGFGIASALLVLGSVSKEIEKFFEKRHILLLIGDASYSIYLVHLWAQKEAFNLAGSFSRRVLNIILDDGVGQSLIISNLLFIFIVVMSVIFGILIHLKVERTLLFFLRKKMNVAKS